MISDNLTRLTYLFPWSIIFALLLAALFAFIGILIFRRSIKKAEEGPKPVTPNPFFEKSKILLARYGYAATDQLSISFTKALKLLHNYIGGSEFRYQLPWVVMLGASSSGKSTLLDNLEVDRPIGRPLFTAEGEDKPLCDWAFFDHGVVLDVNGKLVIDANQARSDEALWDLFLNLLTSHRPKRPVDGVVINIPVTELIGKEALSHEDILIRADYIYEKLWQMQKTTGLRIPVYFVITKSDLIPGFESFCKSIPNNNKTNIFGWSNDKSIDTVYVTDWVDEAFFTINEALYVAQEEIYAESKNIDGRDGVFLFPMALNKVRSGIKTYANHIFKPSGYHESFFFRGIYFVGDSHIERSRAKSQGISRLAVSKETRSDSKSKNIYFIRDLFEKKIFREIGLARPVSRVLLGNTNSLRLLKIGVVIVSILGTLELLISNSKLNTAKVNLTPVLKQVELSLEKIRGQSDSASNNRTFFYDQAQMLLNTMAQVRANSLSAPFIPASWFSNINSKISFVMGLAYDQVILKSMSSQLAYKAQQLVDINTVLPVAQQPGNGIDPLQTTEFYQLQKYVLSMRELELATNKFNELGLASNLKDVADIIKYLFEFDMPAEFLTHDLYFKDALAKSHNKLFDLESYREDASIKLNKLFDQFENAVFDPVRMIPGLGFLMTSINAISGSNYGTGGESQAANDVDSLHQVYQSLQDTNNSIANPGFSWLNYDYFSPGPQYEYVMGQIFESTVFSVSTSAELKTEIDQNFIGFRKKLAEYKSSLIDGGNLFDVENGLALARPSLGSLRLQQNLALFFSEPFMARAEDRTIVVSIPLGSTLLWDTLRLQQSVSLISSYNDFINSRLLGLPKNLQPMLQKVARESLARNLVQQIANAQVLSTVNFRENSFAPEDALLTQIQNYRSSAPFLQQILFSLNANNINAAFSTLKQLLTNENYSLLTKLDGILSEEGPYAIKMDSFEWWKGNNMAALEAYGANTLAELKNYLDLQRDRIAYLAQEFAEPVVSFLELINSEGMHADLPLMNKWAGIINELNGYKRKAPGNGLTELESYILKPLNEVTLDTCDKYTKLYNNYTLKGDYFVNVLVDLEDKLHKQCANLSGFVSVDNYTQLANFFNANLAGRFPFTEEVKGQADASPEDIRTFFQMMDSQAAGIKATLKQAKDLGPAGKKAFVFIEQMEGVRKFFGGFLVPDSLLPYPSYTFDVAFRVNKQREVRGNEVLDWQVTSGGTTFNMRSPSHKCGWKVGNPVKVTFRWAANSPLQPLVTEGSSGLSVDGEYASYSYGGTWGLIRLLREHQAKTCDFDNLNDDQPTTLRFNIPLTNVMSGTGLSNTDPLKATVFLRFVTSPVPNPKPKKGEAPKEEEESKEGDQTKIKVGEPVALPFFPFNAPNIKGAAM